MAMRYTGKVIELGDRKSGLIKRDGVSEHLFFHEDALIDIDFRDLHMGHLLVFCITESRKGPYATEINLAA